MATDDQQRPTGSGSIKGLWRNELIEVFDDIYKVDATQAQSVPPTHRQEEQHPTIYFNPLSSTGSAVWPNAVEHHYIAETVIHGSSPENRYENTLGPIAKKPSLAPTPDRI